MTPDYDTAETRPFGCKYLVQDGTMYICELTDSRFSDVWNPNVEVTDREKRHPVKGLQEVPQEVYDYWIRECQPYPNPDNLAHCPPRHTLLVECGFTLTEV